MKTSKRAKARWFPYAAEGSQVWYMMPEPGAKVKLYFPSAEEDEAMVMQSVREEPKEAAHTTKSSKGCKISGSSRSEIRKESHSRSETAS